MTFGRSLFHIPTADEVEAMLTDVALRTGREHEQRAELERKIRRWQRRERARERKAEQLARQEAERRAVVQLANRRRDRIERRWRRKHEARFRERQTLNRVDWFELTGCHVSIADRQRGYERNKLAARMYATGEFTLDNVGARFGVSRERARQMVAKAARQKEAPIERWMAPVAPVVELLELHKEHKGVARRLARTLTPFAYPHDRDWLHVASGGAR